MALITSVTLRVTSINGPWVSTSSVAYNTCSDCKNIKMSVISVGKKVTAPATTAEVSLLPTFVIEGNAKFWFEVSKNNNVYFFSLISWIPFNVICRLLIKNTCFRL